MIYLEKTKIKTTETREILSAGASKVAPLWSLENFVAVNPYLGLTDMPFEDAMEFLNMSGKAQATLPTSFYLEALQKGQIEREDIAKALKNNSFGFLEDAEGFIEDIYQESTDEDIYIRTMSDVASEINGKKWGRFMTDRISFWASAYFDNNQAIWDTAKNQESLFGAWKKEAEVDYSPEAMGLKGFRKLIQTIPNNYQEAVSKALKTLDIPQPSMGLYLNSLLMKMNGWAGFTARIDWDARLAEKESHATEEFLAILLVWEMCLKELLHYPHLDQVWKETKADMLDIITEARWNQALSRKLILQAAFDIANQRRIVEKINGQKAVESTRITPKAQAIFCIDVRSELYRRNLEAADDAIETMGFAGFFAFPIKYVPTAHDEGANQCPVLLTTSHTIREQTGDHTYHQKAMERRTLKGHVAKAWKSFKLGAVSCFGFVSPLGLFFLPKLFTDAFGITRPVPHPDKAGLSREDVAQKGIQLDQENWADELAGIPVADRLNMAASALRAMSLTENFARTVLIVGHGASTVNNPHATGLDCGACGGHSGEANAKVAAAVLNDPEVRKGLKDQGIEIPKTTAFIAALHDTTTDEVSLFNVPDSIKISHRADLEELETALKMAGQTARKERAKRMNVLDGDINKRVIDRSKDWSQVRPEWGLAGCSSFIVAPRERTAQLNFEGKAFMHSYDWRKDKEFSVLELIMTAPMVVTSWINLQYYASAVDNKKFGSGNKTLHNVVGGLGVLEGFAGDLRVGLPWQSVHDGGKFQHEPQRLNVIIEAPVDQMSKILEKHEPIRQLCDNHWIYLFAMNDNGKVAYKYIGNLEWEVVS